MSNNSKFWWICFMEYEAMITDSDNDMFYYVDKYLLQTTESVKTGIIWDD